jgi:uncharacterized damage-inducible protein DinB
MNYYGAQDLCRSFLTVRNNTLTIAEEIPEERYGFQATPDSRTVAQTLVHIAWTPRIQEQIQRIERRTTLEGFDFPSWFMRMQAEEKTPHTKAEILKMLTEGRDEFAGWLETLSDEFLGERVAMRAGMEPADKSRFEMLLGVKEHEMHHRAQLMLMERMIGIVPHLTRAMQARMAAVPTAASSAS